jgi:uncharacterized protein (TIGR02271 family)
MAHTVVAVFNNESDAQAAVRQLEQSGFSNSDIDISNSGSNVSDTSDHSDRHEGGSAIGRFFRSLFGDDDDDSADRYSRVAERGGAIVTVHARSEAEAERAADMLDDLGAIDVDEHAREIGHTSTSRTGDTTSGDRSFNLGSDDDVRSDSYRSGTTDYTSTDRVSDTDRSDSDFRDTDSNRSIPVIHEDLEVGKRTVETGRVRLKSRIVEKEVAENVRLRQEHVRVDRNQVDRPASSDDLDNFSESELEVVEHAEVPVVNKQARVVEEISLDKEVEENEETVRDTVRRTEVDVDEDRSRNNNDKNLRNDRGL